MVSALRGLTANLGMAGALVGFTIDLIVGPDDKPADPQIAKLQDMIGETQSLILTQT